MSGDITLVADRPPAVDADDVERLLHPIGVAGFTDRFWQQRPVHLTGCPDRFSGLFTRATLRDLLGRQQELGLPIRVSSDHESQPDGAAAHVLVEATEVGDHLRDGTSLCIDGVERAVPAVAALANRLRQGLAHRGPVTVKCYFSTTGFGFNTHFDAQVVTTLQLEGTKRWRVSSAPGVPFPVSNGLLDADGTVRLMDRPPSALRPWEAPEVDRRGFVEVTLRPGDVLCLPAGTWHEAKAQGESSLALNMSFSPADVLDSVMGVLRPRAEELEPWRAGLPAGAALDGQWLGDRLQELADLARSVAQDPGPAAQELAEAAPGDGAGPLGGGPAAAALARAASQSALHEGQRLQCVLGVADVARAAEWYGRVLGSTVVNTIAAYGWTEVSTPIPGVTLGLTEMPTAVANRGAVLDFEVDDLDRLRARLAENGVVIAEPATEIAGLATMLSAHDLDGNQLMFFQPHTTGGQ